MKLVPLHAPLAGRMSRHLLILLWVVAGGSCTGVSNRAAPRAHPDSSTAPATVSAPDSQAGDPAVAGMIAEALSPRRLQPPGGYVEMTVAGVGKAGDGHAVLLADRERSVLVPIFIGDAEALAISLRLNSQKPPRPLTHDLLESVLGELEARVLKVQIDQLHDNVFIGSLFIQHDNQTRIIDARSSDAIALALGADAPIYVSRAVITQAGLSEDQLQQAPPDDAAP